MAPDWWSSSAGYIRLAEDKTWCAYLHRNTRVGRGWTETKPGFRTSDRAKRWIEREAEE
jgi:hypothetical protein